jgi:hypothetical protein
VPVYRCFLRLLCTVKIFQSCQMKALSWLAALLFLIYTPTARCHDVVEEMASAANKFLASLSTDEKAKAVFEFKDAERLNWHFVPKDRKGLAFREMSSEQQRLAHALIRSAMSQHGYQKATNIMSLELVLQELEGAGRRFPRDPGMYYVSVFGKPAAKGPWAWRLEGHHVAVNITAVDGKMVTSTPSFFGSNPAEVRQGPRQGMRVLAEEEDLSRAFMKSLPADLRKAAIFSETAPKEIITEAKVRVQPLDKTGLEAARLSAEQKQALLKVIKAYVERFRPELAKDDLAEIDKAGFDKIQFAWAGGIERGEGHYYRIQGPTFLMEYDNTQNNNNHIHAVWREFESDFGEDLLRKHYKEYAHP